MSALERDAYDTLLLDYSLAGENGLDFLRSLEGQDAIPPVIMLTSSGDVRVAKDAIGAGAYDYFCKESIDLDAVGSAILEALEEARLQAEEKRQPDDHQRLAFLGPLTGLYNRRYLDEALERECMRVRRYWSLVSL